MPTETSHTEEMSDEDFAAFLAETPHGVSPEETPADEAPMDLAEVEVTTAGGNVNIDFQGQYDNADIPNTDEVEQLQGFLTRLDESLPLASKVAAAEAFLGAVGKSREDVLKDAERKIQIVRHLARSKQHGHDQTVAEHQAAITDLQQQIDQRREQIEQANGELEGFRRACTTEEARLQAAHVFFGQAGDNPRVDKQRDIS